MEQTYKVWDAGSEWEYWTQDKDDAVREYESANAEGMDARLYLLTFLDADSEPEEECILPF